METTGYKITKLSGRGTYSRFQTNKLETEILDLIFPLSKDDKKKVKHFLEEIIKGGEEKEELLIFSL